MKGFKFTGKDKIQKIPMISGVYVFEGKGILLYVGKAKNLRIRVKNHFNQPSYRDNLFMDKVEKVGYIQTNSEIEALILESKLIKSLRPKFNVIWKDDKNYFFVEITKETCPRILLTHQPIKQISNSSQFIGPFVDGDSIKRTLKLLRRIFPYYTAKKHPKNRCSWCHLGLCPGPEPDIKKYKKDIGNLKLVLKGKRSFVLRKIKQEMLKASKSRDFETAMELRDKFNSLQKVLENAKVIKEAEQNESPKHKTKIEGYDISNIQGDLAVGSMVVFEGEKPNKSLYRKFRIRMKNEPNDTAMIKEVISRRLKHPEWPLPKIMLIDGGKGQLNAALFALGPAKSKIKVMALAKKHNELFIDGEEKPILLKNMPKEFANLILRVRDEAHRFAIAYHHKLRKKELE